MDANETNIRFIDPSNSDGTTANIPPKFYAAIASFLLFVLAGFFGYQIGTVPVEELHQTNARVVAQDRRDQAYIAVLKQQMNNLVSRDSHCYPYTSEISTLQKLVSQGAVSLAASLAKADLISRVKRPCPAGYQAIAGIWYSASMTGLLSSPAVNPLDRSTVLTWRSIEKRANDLGIPVTGRYSATTVFAMAFNNQDWWLALAAFQEAWDQGLVGHADLASIDKDYAANYNEARALERLKTPEAMREMGPRYATAAAISARYRLGGEAAAALARLYGADRRRWPSPNTSDVVLAR